jgi:hypothetical protein
MPPERCNYIKSKKSEMLLKAPSPMAVEGRHQIVELDSLPTPDRLVITNEK